MANTGTKTWKDVRLVHQVGYTPVSTEIDVPDLKPEEQTILTVEYPPIGTGQGDQITRYIQKRHQREGGGSEKGGEGVKGVWRFLDMYYMEQVHALVGRMWEQRLSL